MNTSCLPTLLISENEGERTARYHRHHAEYEAAHPEQVFYLMPRTSDEFNEIYEHFKSGKVVSKCLSPLEKIWSNILANITSELTFRSKDMQKPIIDEFLAAFNDFLKITKDFHDQSFLEPFYDSSNGLKSTLRNFCLSSETYLKENPDLTWDMIHIPYIVSRINDMLAENSNIDYDYNEYFQSFCVREDYKNLPEYAMMYEYVESIFKDGVPILMNFDKK